MTYDEDCGAITSQGNTEIWVRPYALSWESTDDIELEVEGGFVAIPKDAISEVILCLDAAKKRIEAES